MKKSCAFILATILLVTSLYTGMAATPVSADTVGETAVFEVKASGTNLTYQWQYCNANSSVWRASSMEGSTTARVSVPVTAGRDGQKYRCVITSGNGRTAITETAVMTVQK